MFRTRKTLSIFLYLLSVHALCLLAFSICRVVLFLANLSTVPFDFSLLWRAMLIGIKFDNLICCYVTALPLVVLMSMAFFVKNERALRVAVKSATCFYAVVFGLGIAVEIANARYFGFFENHLNINVAEWFAFLSDTAGLVFGDSVNWLFIVLGLALIALYEWALFAICRSYLKKHTFGNFPVCTPPRDWLVGLLTTFLAWSICFCGIRGSFQRYPLGVSFAYFCQNSFYNKLGVNPIFNIIKSAKYSKKSMPKILEEAPLDDAIEFVRNEFGCSEFDSICPIARNIPAKNEIQRKNVVIVLMEGMAACHLDKVVDNQFVTPYLRALKESSVYFKSCYSSGVHTNNAVTSVNYGYLPNFAKATMTVPSQLYAGLPFWLRKNGYQTLFFYTGNPQYDNMNSFLRDNNYDQIFSLYDYPQSAAVNNFGVPDDYMLTYALQKLGEYSQNDKPFLATLLTVSNHMPYVVPQPFDTLYAGNQSLQILTYADHALQQFMTAAQATDWGKNTIFVLIGDHGTYAAEQMYSYTYDYNHIAAFWVENGRQSCTVETPVSQVDMAPTLLSQLGLLYQNNTLGIDIFNEKRRFACFVNNDQMACSDGIWLYAYSINSQQENLYRLGCGTDLIAVEPAIADTMRRYLVNTMKINFVAKQQGWIVPPK